MKETKFSKIVFIINIFFFVLSVFLFYQNMKLKKEYKRLFNYSKFLESKIELGSHQLPSVSFNNLNGYSENLNIKENQKHVLFLVSPIDCPPCFQEAREINTRIRIIENLNIAWIFFGTNLTELEDFLGNINFEYDSKILFDVSTEGCKKIFGCETPTIIFSEGRKIKYIKKLHGNPNEVDQIINEIKLLF